MLVFYPKFGFKRAQKHQYSKQIDLDCIQSDLAKLKMSDKENKEFLLNKINRSLPVSLLSMLDSPFLPKCHCNANYTDNLYCVQQFEAVVVANFAEPVLYLKDVFCEKEIFCEKEVPLDELILAFPR